ncbi:MAG: hypothetical protein HY758_05375 [Nitrospirae bacterium]|nr:hypothetical protein [Nitrospirota bacterium]
MMEQDSEKILMAILEESPVYLSLTGHERRLLIADLKIVYLRRDMMFQV